MKPSFEHQGKYSETEIRMMGAEDLLNNAWAAYKNKDYDTALQLYLIGAAEDEPFCCHMCAEIYLDGSGNIERDVEKAAYFFEIVLKDGTMDLLEYDKFRLGTILCKEANGDKARGMSLLKEAVASDDRGIVLDSAVAILNLCDNYEDYLVAAEGIERGVSAYESENEIMSLRPHLYEFAHAFKRKDLLKVGNLDPREREIISKGSEVFEGIYDKIETQLRNQKKRLLLRATEEEEIDDYRDMVLWYGAVDVDTHVSDEKQQLENMEKLMDVYRPLFDKNVYPSSLLKVFTTIFLEHKGDNAFWENISEIWRQRIEKVKPQIEKPKHTNMIAMLIWILIGFAGICFLFKPDVILVLSAHFFDSLTVIAAILTIIGFGIMSFAVIPVLVIVVVIVVKVWEFVPEAGQLAVEKYGASILLAIIFVSIIISNIRNIMDLQKYKALVRKNTSKSSKYVQWANENKTKITYYIKCWDRLVQYGKIGSDADANSVFDDLYHKVEKEYKSVLSALDSSN